MCIRIEVIQNCFQTVKLIAHKNILLVNMFLVEAVQKYEKRNQELESEISSLREAFQFYEQGYQELEVENLALRERVLRLEKQDGNDVQLVISFVE